MQMEVLAVGTAEMLCRPCVDCGRRSRPNIASRVTQGSSGQPTCAAKFDSGEAGPQSLAPYSAMTDPIWIDSPRVDSPAMMNAFLKAGTRYHGQLTVRIHRSLFQAEATKAWQHEVRPEPCSTSDCFRCDVMQGGYAFRWFHEDWAGLYVRYCRGGYTWTPGETAAEAASKDTLYQQQLGPSQEKTRRDMMKMQVGLLATGGDFRLYARCLQMGPIHTGGNSSEDQGNRRRKKDAHGGVEDSTSAGGAAAAQAASPEHTTAHGHPRGSSLSSSRHGGTPQEKATSTQPKIRTCCNCHQNFIPAGPCKCTCGQAIYCGLPCQSAHWKEHKRQCPAKVDKRQGCEAVVADQGNRSSKKDPDEGLEVLAVGTAEMLCRAQPAQAPQGGGGDQGSAPKEVRNQTGRGHDEAFETKDGRRVHGPALPPVLLAELEAEQRLNKAK